VYASFNPENISCGIGTVIRDGNGDFIVTWNDPIQYAIDANTLETQAISRDIALANEVNCARIMIGSGCLQVIEILQTGELSSTSTATYYNDIYVQASTFSACKFSL
jgi:hypothetical protein